MKKLEDKMVVITGATSGIGEACAKLFAKEGAKVIIVGRDEKRGKQVENDILSQGDYAEFLPCDVTIEEDVMDLKKVICEKYDRIDILFNNAGLLITSALEEINGEDWKKIFDVNTNAVMYMTKNFIDKIVESKGNILTNASIDGLQSNIRGRATYMYASSKAATIQFMKICALNYSDRIRVNCICPGVTETPFFTNRDFSRFNSSIPMGRVAKPEEIAKAALFLVSDDASYITGSVLTVDGGASIM